MWVDALMGNRKKCYLYDVRETHILTEAVPTFRMEILSRRQRERDSERERLRERGSEKETARYLEDNIKLDPSG
jgi:hypothetical protein